MMKVAAATRNPNDEAAAAHSRERHNDCKLRSFGAVTENQIMANTGQRGGKKQGSSRARGNAKKVGVRAGSTASAKERLQKHPRRPQIDR
jgi:hypothetical protein